jgi:hypothetical protein
MDVKLAEAAGETIAGTRRTLAALVGIGQNGKGEGEED